jgi:sugar phosphate isomerase/epimerase
VRLDGWGAHLGYCTNIHPGESWDEIDANLRRYLPVVKSAVSPDSEMGVGLRLGGAAAEALAARSRREALREWLDENGLYVFTINGFPHGRFHGTRVKEQVYRPDWREDERLSYSNALAHILADLLPPHLEEGTISTVPAAFHARVSSEADSGEVAARLLAHAAELRRIHDATGKTIRLALEPEPWCHLETTDQTISFFERNLFSTDDAAARRHLGVCLDTCHLAVGFESPAEALSRYERAGIGVYKVQLSAGLEVDSGVALEELSRYADDVYLHQVVVEAPRGLLRHLDLPGALAARPAGRWRVHFHVPLFRERLGPFRATQAYVAEVLALLRRDGRPRDLEVETYTWEVLPAEHRDIGVAACVARELDWVLGQVRGSA